MSKLIGRRVKLVVSCGNVLGLYNGSTDPHAIGQTLRIVNTEDPLKSNWPVQCCDNYSRCALYKPEQLRYLNNKKVEL